MSSAANKTRPGRLRMILTGLIATSVAALGFASSAQAEFGFVPGSVVAKAHAPATHDPPAFFQPEIRNGVLFGPQVDAWRQAILDAGETTQAGSHPDFSTSFQMNLEGPASPDESLRDLVVDSPAGLIGNPTAAPRCTAAEFHLGAAPKCAPGSQVGFAAVNLNILDVVTPVYSLVPPPGAPAQFAFKAVDLTAQLTPEVRSDGDYGLRISSKNTPTTLDLLGATVTLWGAPHDPVHDAQRVNQDGTLGGAFPSVASGFLTSPTDCNSGPQETTIRARSWQDANTWVEESIPFPKPTGCEGLVFGGPGAEAKLTAQPTSTKADSPTGLDVNLTVPYTNTVDQLANPTLRDAEVTLPEGMAINPAAANGLGACTEAQIGLDSLDPQTCPDSSKLGSVQIDTPLLDNPMKGSVYQAEQDKNPFNSTFAIYVAAEGSGVQIKLPGEISPDPETGQLAATFTDNPQLPFTNFNLRFFGGPSATLVNPSTCGIKTTEATLTPWSAPDSGPPAESTDTFTIDKGPDGNAASCATDLADRPFNPTMSAGTLSSVAGSSSPFVFRLQREDGDQEILSTTVKPPQGLTAKLAGIPYCSEADVAAISCPEESRIGSEVAGAGAGSSPFYTTENPGSVYLAGPYKGAPLSMVITEPVVAGPFDLDDVSVRAAIHVDKRTAELTVISDEIPQINSGIPLRIRDLRIKMNRPDFTIAPTNCDPMEVNATVEGSHGATANLTNHFQVGDCGHLGFSPKLKLDLGKSKKATKPGANPPLNANLSFNEGDSNISQVEVALPQGVLLDDEQLGFICSQSRYEVGTCPESSLVGYAKATTPLLDDPVEGPVYLKASTNPLPDLAADLNGQIDIDLIGRIDQKQNKKGINQIRNTFDVVPDVPVSSFELKLSGGSEGLLENSSNLCSSKKTQRLSIDMVAHNERTLSERPLIGSACKQLNKKKAKKLKRKIKKLKRKARKADSPKRAKQLRKKAKRLKRQAKKLGR